MTAREAPASPQPALVDVVEAPPPEVTVVGVGEIWRHSATGAPPWTHIVVTNIFGFDRQPPIGAKVSVVPLHVELPVLELAIAATQKRHEIEEAPVWWDVELEPVSERAYFLSPSPEDRVPEYPTGVLVLHPAVRGARAIRRDSAMKFVSSAGVTPSQRGSAQQNKMLQMSLQSFSSPGHSPLPPTPVPPTPLPPTPAPPHPRIFTASCASVRHFSARPTAFWSEWARPA